jgi:RNAse (barnase) inhibitor barstar
MCSDFWRPNCAEFNFMQEIGSDLNTLWTAMNEDMQGNVKASVTLGTLEWKFWCTC